MNDLRYNILIGKTQKQFADRGFECILGVVLVLGTIALLMFFLNIGIALAFVVTPFLCVGIKKYLVTIAKGDLVAVENIYNSYKIWLKAFCLKVATSLISILWGILFIIPGIISMINYSMAMFILADNPNLSSFECMAKSKKLVDGNRGEIFIIYLCYFLVSIMVLTIFGALGIAIKYFTNAPVWVPIVSMGLLFLFVLVIFIIPYFELMFANAYLELKKAKEPAKKASALVEEKQTVAKKQTRKTTTKNKV